MAIRIPKAMPTKDTFNPLEIDCPPTDNIQVASYAMVGEYPTQIEVMEKTPFKGPIGQQFNRIGAAAKIPRYKIYLTHACKSMLPNNNVKKLWTDKGFRHHTWGQMQYDLIEELSHFKGKLIILLGATPMKLLLDSPKINDITKYRGSIYKAEDFSHLKEKLAGKLIAITYSPAVSLARMKPVNFYIILADFNKFTDLEADHTLFDQEVVIKTKPLLHEIKEHYHQCMQMKELGFDIESTPEYITCFSLAYELDGIITSMSIPLMNNRGNYWTVDEEIEIWRGLAKILLHPKIGMICQNGMFDIMFVLRTMNIVSDNFLFDTMIAQHIVYTDLPKGLDFLTSVYTYFQYYKDEGKQSHFAAIKDWSSYWVYNAKDSAYLLPIKKKLQEEIDLFGVQDAMNYSMSLHKPLMEMEWNGIMTDQDGMQKSKKSFQRRYEAIKHGLHKLVGHELNTNSPKQMVAYFYGTCMIKPYVQRSGKGKGNPTCNMMALSRIARKRVKGSVEAKMIMKLRKYGKLLSTYFINNVDADHKLRSSYKITGTVTGRLSSEQTFFGTGANLQNQPYLFKKFLIPDKDHILCEVDLAKAEAHVVAYLCQDGGMIEAFESGIDVHSYNAGKIFGKSIEEIKAEKRIPGKLTMRDLGKKVVHASNYGMGPQTFSDNLAKEEIYIDFRTCKNLLSAYSVRFPELHRWHKLIETEVMENRVLYNLFGRPKRFLGLMNSALYRNAYAYKPQSTVAELLNRGTVKIANDPMLGQAGYDIALMTTVHDSDVFQFHKEHIPNLLDILLRIKDHMTHTFTHLGRKFTIGLDAKIGYQWAGKTAEIEVFNQENVSKALIKIGAI